jgi:hypothetical protein
MIRRRRRTPKQEELLLYKQTAPTGIGETIADAVERKHTVEAEVIQSVHDYIWQTRPCCQLCGGSRKDECMGLPDQMHEDPPRSATRGRPPAERFNLIVCGLRIRFVNPALGFLGPLALEG